MGYARGDGEPAEDYAERLHALLLQRDAEIQELRASLGSPAAAGMEDMSSTGDATAAAAALGGGGGLEEAEALLAERTSAARNPAVLQLLAGLQEAVVYTDTPNYETNRKLWDAYARGWTADADWVQRMAGHLPGDARDLGCVGDEWSDEASLDAVLGDWVLSALQPSMRVAEIGSGGGRIAGRVAGRVRELVCFDISAEMLGAARKHLEASGHGNVRFEHIRGDEAYPVEYQGKLDCVYSFDVFVHMDLHSMRHALRCAHDLLRPGGCLIVSFANLLAPDGWRRFARQKKYSVGGFYFVSPDIARCLLLRAGLEICRMSSPQAGNTYLNRDLLVVARRPAAVPPEV